MYVDIVTTENDSVVLPSWNSFCSMSFIRKTYGHVLSIEVSEFKKGINSS